MTAGGHSLVFWRWPLASNVIRRHSERNTFGMTRLNADGTRRPHQGWDLAAPLDTPCRAIGAGVVEAVTDAGDYGLQVLIRQDDPHKGAPVWAFYAHLSSTSVNAGDRVAPAQVIGATGESGNARGMPAEDQHLHFEVRTEPHPGRGLAGRISPLELYGVCPLHAPVEDP